jgi:hypothetical protein
MLFYGTTAIYERAYVGISFLNFVITEKIKVLKVFFLFVLNLTTKHSPVFLKLLAAQTFSELGV